MAMDQIAQNLLEAAWKAREQACCAYSGFAVGAALLSADESWTVDDVLRAGEAYAAVGTATVMASAVGDDPAGKVETLFGPSVEQLKQIEPLAL